MDLIQIKAESFWNRIHERHGEQGGVYKVIAFQDGQRVTIHRFLGQDADGVLYIGKANSFVKRVIELKKSISPDYDGDSHGCGKKYKSNPRIAAKFPFEILYMELIENNKPGELEKEYLKDYEKTFGEVPPLNQVTQ